MNKTKSKLTRNLIFISILIAIIGIIFTILYISTDNPAFQTIAISFFVTAYHFIMRLIIALLFNVFMKNKANLKRGWYKQHFFEPFLYKVLLVKKWKNHIPTAYPEAFDPSIHTYEEIAMAMCQSEISHEVIIILSLLPIFLIIPFGTWPAFVFTSLASFLFDSIFVIVQRYNRPRIIHLIKLKENYHSVH